MDSQGDAYFTNLFNSGIKQNMEYSFAQHHNITNQTATSKKAKVKNFTNDEDLLLVTAWLNTSTNAAEGTDQSSTNFWERIYDYFHKENEFESNRSKNSLMHRWSTIQLAVNKFCGFYAQVEQLRRSGVTEQNKIKEANDLYTSEMDGQSFPYLHCWHELKYQPKWMLVVGGSKKQRNSKSVTPASSYSSTPETINLGNDNIPASTYVNLERPLGKKAMKQQLKKGKGKRSIDGSTSVPIASLLQEIMEEKIEMSRKKLDLLEKTYVQDEQKIELERMRLQLKESKAEERIMTLDTSNMDAMIAEYYNRRKMEILSKMKDLSS